MTRVAVGGSGSAQAGSAQEALEVAGYEVVPLALEPLAGAVEVLRSCAVAVPMDAALAGLCDLVGLPYVGSPPRARAIAADRWLTRLVAQAAGVRTPSGTLVTRGEARHVAGLLADDLPMVVTGVGLARTPAELVTALDAAFARDNRVLVEEVVAGPEIDVVVVGRPDGSRTVTSAQLTPAQVASVHVREVAITVYDALGCAGLARVAFVATPAGAVLREVQTMPVVPPELLDLLVRDALAPLAVAV